MRGPGDAIRQPGQRFQDQHFGPKKLLATGLGDVILMVNDIAQILLTAIDVILEAILAVLANFVDAMIADIQSASRFPYCRHSLN